jgi:hypothetical protein
MTILLILIKISVATHQLPNLKYNYNQCFFWANFCNLTNLFQKRKRNMKKTLGFFNAFKMPRSRYGDFDKMSPNMEPVFFDPLPQKSSNMFIPITTRCWVVIRNKRKKDPRLFSVQFLAFIITALKRIKETNSDV